MENWWRAAPWLLAAGIVGLYRGALTGGILDWDDETWVLDPILELPLTQAVAQALTTAHDHAWYPLLRLSWWLQVAVFGESTFAMHAVNLALFAGCIGLLGQLLARLGLAPPAALVATALWAAHPSRVESVAWLTSRKDLLSLLFLLGAAHLLVRNRPNTATLLFGLACLTKAAVFPVAGVFALLAWARRQPVADASGMLGLGAGTAVFGLVAYTDPERAGYPYGSLVDDGLFVVGLQSAWWRRLVELGGSAAVYPLPSVLWPGAVAAVSLLGGAAALASTAGRWGALLLGVWLLPLLPVHGLVSMPFWGADRHLLIPSIAVAVAIAWAAERWLRWWVPIVLLLPLGWSTLHRIPAWHDSHALWAADASRPGDHWVRRLKFGTVLGREGDFAGAEREFRAAEALQPGRSDVLARRLLAELAKDGWTSQDAAVARGLQPPPTTAEQWAHITDVLVQVQHPSACDASAQTVHLGGPAHPSCP